MKAVDALDVFVSQNGCKGFADRQAMDKMYCHGQVARTVVYYIGCQTKVQQSKDYTLQNFSDDVVKEVRLLKGMLDAHGGMKAWVPAPMLQKLNKTVMDAK